MGGGSGPYSAWHRPSQNPSGIADLCASLSVLFIKFEIRSFHKLGNFDNIKVRSQSVNMNFDQNIGGISIQKLGIRVVLSYADLLLQATSGNCSSILHKAK